MAEDFGLVSLFCFGFWYKKHRLRRPPTKLAAIELSLTKRAYGKLFNSAPSLPLPTSKNVVDRRSPTSNFVVVAWGRQHVAPVRPTSNMLPALPMGVREGVRTQAPLMSGHGCRVKREITCQIPFLSSLIVQPSIPLWFFIT